MRRIPETLPAEVLTKMHAPPKPDYPIISVEELLNFDAFILGVPTRYGNFPGQWKASFFAATRCDPKYLIPLVSPHRQAFWDATGKHWSTGALAGKFAGVFVSTGTQGGGQEATIINSLSTLAHHGIVYVPLGYSRTFAQFSNVSEAHGGASLFIVIGFFKPNVERVCFRIALGCGCDCRWRWESPTQCA